MSFLGRAKTNFKNQREARKELKKIEKEEEEKEAARIKAEQQKAAKEKAQARGRAKAKSKATPLTEKARNTVSKMATISERFAGFDAGIPAPPPQYAPRLPPKKQTRSDPQKTQKAPSPPSTVPNINVNADPFGMGSFGGMGFGGGSPPPTKGKKKKKGKPPQTVDPFNPFDYGF